MKKIQNQKANIMSFSNHINELKIRIIFCIIIFVTAFGYCFVNQNIIFNYFLESGKNIGFAFVYISPQEVMIQQLKLVSILALMLTLPFIILQICLFVSVGLKMTKRIFITIYGLFSLLFYVIGEIFAIKIILPNTMSFLFSVNASKIVASSVSVEKYISFSITLIVTIGLIFEIPVICSLLAFCGIIDGKVLKTIRPYIIVLIFIIAAIITPPDVISQFIVAVPMLCLYELSIIIVIIISKIRRRTNEKVSISI